MSRYLEEWYRLRALHSKALVAMLAWIEHPNATELLLSVGFRYPTKGLQDEVARQVAALAERKGWTPDEFADRTVPRVGLDQAGVLDLDYGDRAFFAVLLPEMRLELRSPEGKTITTLPGARRSDDAGRIQESKKALAAARKEFTTVVQGQTERLREAWHTQRTWPFEEWDRYLAHHPIVGRLVQRPVWTATVKAAQVAFRLLDDGTLTDADDAPVTVAADAQVRVAHDFDLGTVAVTAWQQHLHDYEITPVFDQFGTHTAELAPQGGSSLENLRVDDYVQLVRLARHDERR